MAKITYISAEELRKLHENSNILICDIREHDEFNREHILGAINTPLSIFDNKQIENIENTEKIVIHCLSGNRTKMNETKFANIDKDEILILDGGINAWKKIGGIVNKNTKSPLPIMRQVQIVAGFLILLGIVLGFSISPIFFLLSGFVGAGLMFAGITGFCGMANLLMLLPYNKNCNKCQ